MKQEILEAAFKKAFGVGDPSAYDRGMEGAPTVNDSNWEYWFKRLTNELKELDEND